MDEQEKNGTLLSDDYIEEEIVADAVGDMINDFDLAKDIALRLDHPTLYAMKKAVDKVAGLFGKTNPYGKQARALGDIIYDAYNRTRNEEEYSAEELKAMNEKAEQSIKADEAKRKAEEEAKAKQNAEQQKTDEGKAEEGKPTESKTEEERHTEENKTDDEPKMSLRDSEDEDGIKFSLIGERGAANLDDFLDEDRMANLDVARQMEKDGMNSKDIWLATSWERGADGKWRSEIPDVKVNKKVYDRASKTGLKVDLSELVSSDKLFLAYPELAEPTVQIKPLGTSVFGEYYPSSGNIAINSALSAKEARGVLTHEIQHAIQHIEGFEQGTNSTKAKELIKPAEKFAKQQSEEARMSYYSDISGAEKKLSAKARKERVESIMRDMDVDYYTANKIVDVEVRKNVPDDVKRNAIAELVARSQNTDEQVKRAAASIHSFVQSSKAYDIYHASMGETEARNTEKRVGYSETKRQTLPPSASEDVSRDTQVPMGADNGEAQMGTKVKARMAAIENSLSSATLTNEQKTIVDVFTGVDDRKDVSITDNRGKSRTITFLQGNEIKAGTRHAIYRHFMTNGKWFDATDILKIPQILSTGQRKELGKRIEYTLTVDGVEYTVACEKKRGKEQFVSFYTNRYATRQQSGSQNTQNSAQTSRVAISPAKVENSSDTSKENDEEVKQSLREEGEDGLKFSVRTKPDPKKTIKVYKLMRLEDDGKLYPLFVDGATPIELGTWYDADSPRLDTLKQLPSGVHLLAPRLAK